MLRPARQILGLALTAFQLPLNSHAQEFCDRLLFFKHCVYPLARPFRKACRYLFFIDLCSAHGRNIDDITYCYKG